MNRLLCKKKTRQTEQSLYRKGRERSLHLDTAFKHRSFADMENVPGMSEDTFYEKGDGEFGGIGKRKPRRDSDEDSDEIYDAKIDFFRYIANANMHMKEKCDTKVKTKEKRKIMFTETSFTGPNYEGQQIRVEMQVGKAERIVTKTGKKTSKAKISTGKDDQFTQSKPFDKSKVVAEDEVEENQDQMWAMNTPSYSVPEMLGSFGMEPLREAKRGRKRSESKIVDSMAGNTPFFEKIGGKMNRCISLPMVGRSSSVPILSNYIIDLEDTSSLHNDDEQSSDNLLDRAATGIAMNEKDDALVVMEEPQGSPTKDDEQMDGITAESEKHGNEEHKSTLVPLLHGEEARSENWYQQEIMMEEPACQVWLNATEFNALEKQDQTDEMKTNVDAQLHDEGIENVKQNNNEYKRDLQHDAGVLLVDRVKTGEGDAAGTIPSDDERLGEDTKQNSSINEMGTVNEQDSDVCGRTAYYSIPPVETEKMPSTCLFQRARESDDAVNLGGENDTSLKAMASRDFGSTHVKYDERSLIKKEDYQHTVQINYTERSCVIRQQITTSVTEKRSLKVKRGHSKDEEDTWSLIPSSVPCGEQRKSDGGAVIGRYLQELSDPAEVVPLSPACLTEDHPSAVDSSAVQRINMHDIELSVRAKSVSFQEGDRDADVELGLGEGREEEKQEPQSLSMLDKLSSLLKEIEPKGKGAKSSARRKLRKRNRGKEKRLQSDDIEMVEMTRGNGSKEAATINKIEESRIGEDAEEMPLDGTFILQGAEEANNEINSSRDRLKNEMAVEKARIKSLIGDKRLSKRLTYTLILVLWAIEADMPNEIFDGISKSCSLNALFKEQIGTKKELIMQNMYIPNVKDDEDTNLS